MRSITPITPRRQQTHAMTHAMRQTQASPIPSRRLRRLQRYHRSSRKLASLPWSRCAVGLSRLSFGARPVQAAARVTSTIATLTTLA